MIRRTPRSTRTDPLFPYTTLFRSTGTIRATASITTIEAVNARRSTRFRRPLENFSGQVRSGHLLRSNGKARSPSAEQGSGRAGLGVEFVFQGLRGRKAQLPRCLDGHGLARCRVPAFPGGAILCLSMEERRVGEKC